MYYLGRKIARIDTILERRNGKNWSNGVSFLDFDNFPQNISIGEYYQQVLIQNSFNWPTYINEHHNIYRSFGPMKINSKNQRIKGHFYFSNFYIVFEIGWKRIRNNKIEANSILEHFIGAR
jgi:hypothetical protein